MEKLKNKRLLIIVSVIFVIAIVATIFVIMSLSGQDSVSKALSLGDKYLSDMNYDSAIREYGRVLSVDPTNVDALAGLVKSYAGKGDVEKAREVFESNLVGTERTDVLRTYGELLDDAGDYSGAVDIVDELISIEDKEEDREWKEELIGKLIHATYKYGEGAHATIALKDGQVLTMGNNVLGALGSPVNLGTETITTELADAGFPGEAASVFSFGANSAVIDKSGALWLAGSGRSGQKDGLTQLIASSGWMKLSGIDHVVKVAGFDGTVFALKDDGTLWVIGQNLNYVSGGEWLNKWTRVTGVGTVIDLQCSGIIAAFLSADGTLYKAIANDYSGSRWEIAARNVSVFSLYDSSLIWRGTNGALYNEWSNISFPENWYDYSTGILSAPFDVKGIASVDSTAYFLSGDGTVHYVSGGALGADLSLSGKATNIYTAGDSCVIELEDGTYVLYGENGTQK